MDLSSSCATLTDRCWLGYARSFGGIDRNQIARLFRGSSQSRRNCKISQRNPKKSYIEVNDVKNFKDLAQKLLDDIKQNREEKEPEWAKSELNEPCIKLENLIYAVDTEFKEKEYAIDFASACQYKTDMYPVFTEALKSISELWIEWQPCNEGP